MRSLELAVLFAVTAAVAEAAPALTPLNGGAAGGTSTTVNASPADQNDPHLDGDLLVYTDRTNGGSSIRYFDFATLLDAYVPANPGDVDLLSDVSGDRISFSRIRDDRTAAMVFERSIGTLTEIDPQPGTSRFGTAIGANTLAFVNVTFGGSDVLAFDLAANGPAINLSASIETDEHPSVSPAGDAVVWVRQAPSTGADILKAVRVGGAWASASIVSSTPDPELNPDTDGITVVYDSVRLGEGDIFFQPLAGGAETRLEISGAQRNPRINAGVISFLSTAVTPGAKSDLFVYVIASNTLWQVTDTPGVGEHLTDIRVLPNGDIRVVWAVEEGASSPNSFDHDIHARTFSLAPAGDTTAPTVTIATPADGALFTKDQFALAAYTCADEPGGSGLASCVGPVASGTPIDTASIGGHLFAVTGTDNAGNAATLEHGYGVVFCVNPFASPVDDLPVLNRVNAGRAVPVKFSLCGDQGLAVFAPSYPRSQQIACDSSAPVDGIEETTAAGASSLRYDAAADQYKYVWKTETGWAGSCRQLVLLLSDGTHRRANFQFR